jgi:hypothetical protein
MVSVKVLCMGKVREELSTNALKAQLEVAFGRIPKAP